VRDLPPGTITFLFSDVEGSTRLLHELGAKGYVAMVGFVFSEAWARSNPNSIKGFLRAVLRALARAVLPMP